MANLKLREKDLIKIGFPKGKVISVAINRMLENYRKKNKQYVLGILKEVLENPDQFAADEQLGDIVFYLQEELEEQEEIKLNQEAKPYQCYGAQNIDQGAKNQIEIAMRLPVTVKGALMADAHTGYGLPIGGVLATKNAVIPYGVGVDIGCRMCLSIFDLRPAYLDQNRYLLKNYLTEHARFGQKVFDDPMDDPILEHPTFKEIQFVKRLKDKAYKQIGTSGGGNHFVEFGLVDIQEPNNEFGLPTGQYVGLLTHSGSRGLGATIAQHYTKIAMDTCYLPKEAKHLAWLDLDSEAGQEYWAAMNLAGDYASACHNHIHKRMSIALGEKAVAVVENHHNFAWKEQSANGEEIVVHRKGATPAGKGVLGVIPGSMTAPGFIVRGTGNLASINSASHGAGRLFSRTKAKNSFTNKDLRAILKKHRVELIGGAIDEAPMAYKDIHDVMAAQMDLVEVLGTFHPKYVRMNRK